MSDVLWLPASSPLFFYAPSPAYFITSSATSPWLGGLDQSLSPPKNTRKSTTGSSSLILPSTYGSYHA